MSLVRSGVRAVLFDLDGTLVEFKFRVKESRIAIIEWLSRNRYDTSKLSPETKTQQIFKEVEKQSDKRNGSFADVKAKLSQILEGFEYAAFKEAKPYAGSLHLLKRLKKSQIISAIVTNSGHGPVTSMLKTSGFAPYLSLVLTREEVGKLKPEPDGLLSALRILRMRAKDSIYVGDSVIDIDAARNAGIPSVAVCSGMYKADVLLKHSPDYLAESIRDIEKFIFGESA